MNDAISSAESPLTARGRFEGRRFSSFPRMAVAALLIAPFFAFIPGGWLFDLILIGGLTYYHTRFLEFKTVKMLCPRCRKMISLNTPWVCGQCGAENYAVEKFPFVVGCLKCSVEQKAYRCHFPGCGTTIHLTEEMLDTPCAMRIEPKVKDIGALQKREGPTEQELKAKEWAEREAELLWEIRQKKLLLEIESLDKQASMTKKLTVEEENKADKERTVELHRIYARELQELEKQCEGDPVLHQMMKDRLESFKERKTL